jgi:hypothetical protein
MALNPGKAKVTIAEVVAEADADAFKVDQETTHFDAQQTKALLRKIDWHLIPFLCLLYLLSFLE